MKTNTVYYKNSQKMHEIDSASIDLIVTSPPYFNVKDYNVVEKKASKQIGDIPDYRAFIQNMISIWQECQRVLKPNGKLAINTMMMPLPKKKFNTQHSRIILDLDNDIKNSILAKTELRFYDRYIWNRLNSSKPLMFGSYPFPPNFYSQNSSEYISIYVKEGKPPRKRSDEIKQKSRLTQKEWVDYTKHIWDIQIPSKSEISYKRHPAVMAFDVAYRCVKLFSWWGDTVLDPFAGSGTTLCAAKKLGRNYVGYEIIPEYKDLIEEKLAATAHPDE